MFPEESPEKRKFQRLESHLQPTRDALVTHWVYPQVKDSDSLRTFMASHVFAVWDFMTLLKTLQRDLTCIDTPWMPPPDRDNARLINEIVLAEESDEVRPGVYMSHLELYLCAMEERGANHGPLDRFLEAMRAGRGPEESLHTLPIPGGTKDFVVTTLELAQGEPHEVAAAFLFGREAIIPDMFKELLDQPVINPFTSGRVGEHVRRAQRLFSRRLAPHLTRSREIQQGPGPQALRLYLERHVELDGDQHGPMGERLLMRLCGTDEARWKGAESAAARALKARHRMWDSVAKTLASGEIDGWDPAVLKPALVLPSK